MSTSPRDAQTPHTGKVVNDRNTLGGQAPTQKNQGARSPQSRSDRESQVGGTNQSRQRRGEPGKPPR